MAKSGSSSAESSTHTEVERAPSSYEWSIYDVSLSTDEAGANTIANTEQVDPDSDVFLSGGVSPDNNMVTAFLIGGGGLMGGDLPLAKARLPWGTNAWVFKVPKESIYTLVTYFVRIEVPNGTGGIVAKATVRFTCR